MLLNLTLKLNLMELNHILKDNLTMHNHKDSLTMDSHTLLNLKDTGKFYIVEDSNDFRTLPPAPSNQPGYPSGPYYDPNAPN